MRNLRDHAERELKLLGHDEEFNKHILDIVDIFSKEGFSGFSAVYAVGIINKILRYEPLMPLTGEDSEWNEIGEGLYQNNRCSRVFKHVNENDCSVYDIDGKVFREPSGSCYTSIDSRVPVIFPYTPRTEYIDVLEHKEESEQ